MNLRHALNTLSKLGPGQKLRVINDELEVEDRYYLQGLQRWLHGDGEAVTSAYIRDLSKVLRAWVLKILSAADVTTADLESHYSLVHAAIGGIQHLQELYPNQTWPNWTHEERLLHQALKHPKILFKTTPVARFPVLQ